MHVFQVLPFVSAATKGCDGCGVVWTYPMDPQHPPSLLLCHQGWVAFVIPHHFSTAILIPHSPSLWEPELHEQVWVLDIHVWRRST